MLSIYRDKGLKGFWFYLQETSGKALCLKAFAVRSLYTQLLNFAFTEQKVRATAGTSASRVSVVLEFLVRSSSNYIYYWPPRGKRFMSQCLRTSLFFIDGFHQTKQSDQTPKAR